MLFIIHCTMFIHTLYIYTRVVCLFDMQWNWRSSGAAPGLKARAVDELRQALSASLLLRSNGALRQGR